MVYGKAVDILTVSLQDLTFVKQTSVESKDNNHLTTEVAYSQTID